MLIGELALANGLSRETLRFYEQLGLIRARRLDNGYADSAAAISGVLAQKMAELDVRIVALLTLRNDCARAPHFGAEHQRRAPQLGTCIRQGFIASVAGNSTP